MPQELILIEPGRGQVSAFKVWKT